MDNLQDNKKGHTGKTTAIYLQNDLRVSIDAILRTNYDEYKSLSHFINVSAARELRRLKEANK